MKTENRVKILAVTNDLLLIVTLAINALANILPIAGRNTGEVSDSFINLFTPSGFTFAIWGIIYLLLIAFASFQSYVAFHKVHPDKEIIQRIGPWFILSCIANIIWILLWHNLMIYLSMVMMIVILISLIKTYTALRIGQEVVHPCVRVCIHIPISIYTGWISVATIANAAALLSTTGWTGTPLSPQFWLILMLVAAVLLGIIALRKNHDIWYAFVIDWALFGILMKHLTYHQSAYILVIITAAVGITLLSVYSIYLVVIGKVYR